MPQKALASIAKKSGASLADVERYWKEAKPGADKWAKKSGVEIGSDRYYQYIMGIVKKRAGGKESVAELVIDMKLLESENDYPVRVYRDLAGEVSFATLDDVHIDPESDARVLLVHRLANEYEWPHNSEFPENIEDYEGSVSELAQKVINQMYPGLLP